MNKIVFEHYPVERLPEDVRAIVGNVQAVTLVIEPDVPSKAWLTSRAEAVSDLLRLKVLSPPEAGSDAVDRVRRLRDEWDD